MNLPKRKPTRLKDYDYSTPGAYFITICASEKRHLFGEIQNDKMQLSDLGRIVEQEILKMESHYQNVRIDRFVIMPNHIHMIIAILGTAGINPCPTAEDDVSAVGTVEDDVSAVGTAEDDVSAVGTAEDGVSAKYYDVPNIVGKFKAGVTRAAGKAFVHSVSKTIWQSSYHDHIIRGEQDYQKIWEYIDTNVIRWEKDCFYNK